MSPRSRRLAFAAWLLCGHAALLPGQRPPGEPGEFAVTPLHTTPGRLLEDLQGPPQRHASAMRLLGFDSPSGGNARLRLTQLDHDPAEEAFLEVALGLGRVAGCVLKLLDSGWASLGCAAVNGDLGEGFTFRKITSAHSDDILARSKGAGCGGGYCASLLSILHLAAGRLHRVFETEEAVTTRCFQQQTKIHLPYDAPAAPGNLIVRTTRRSQPHAAPVCGKPRATEVTCVVYRWDSQAPAFRVGPRRDRPCPSSPLSAR